MEPQTSTNEVLVNTIKTLAMDAVQKADSGHPGMPMGMADAASVLWADFLKVDPAQPAWADRDRFVLSAGHGSMLLYGLLHLAGFPLDLAELKRFRQWGSKTPGHPEHGLTPGVETTTGPLGQGIANAVGMAMAEAHLAARYNRGEFKVVDHMTWGICSDGDLHEGIASEAASLAGHLGLGKLVFLYDDNSITIEGKTDLAWSEDVPKRFEAYGWHVQTVDGHDRHAVLLALTAARAETQRPSLIACKTHIGHGSPNKQDSASSHGSPLGKEEIRLTKSLMVPPWPESPDFIVPDEAVAAFDALRARGALARSHWEETFSHYKAAYPELAAELERILRGELPADLAAKIPDLGDKPMATRVSSGKVLNALAPHLPELWGGSADLAGSTKTLIDKASDFTRHDRSGRNLHFGIREHGMGAILNGMALHGGIIPYGATFLTFSDYMRGAIRLSALMQQKVILVLTHDSIFLGEDGPTHQSVEHAMALRLIPGLTVMRPGDARETAAAWLFAVAHQGPTALLLTRQDLPAIPGTGAGLQRGGYIVSDPPNPDLVLIGTGSELHLCTGAAALLAAQGVTARVVSMPSIERFFAEPAEYRDTVLPPKLLLRISVEAGRTLGWERVVGPLGVSVGLDRFGESAPAEVLAEHFGFTAEHVATVAKAAWDALPASVAALKERLG
ncbi:MAG: transketolase [Deltaproteobacteria bacterium]|nr:transketolase [Deltaproteobacteria bacterium]